MARRWRFLIIFLLTVPAWGNCPGGGGERQRAQRFAMNQVNAGMVGQMRQAWELAGRGNLNSEAAVVIVDRGSGDFQAIVSHDREGYRSMRLVIPPGTVAIFHTHPNHLSGEPSPQDRRNSDRLGIPNFTLTDRGVWQYDPRTRRTSRVMYRLSWLEFNNWREESDLLGEARP